MEFTFERKRNLQSLQRNLPVLRSWWELACRGPFPLPYKNVSGYYPPSAPPPYPLTFIIFLSFRPPPQTFPLALRPADAHPPPSSQSRSCPPRQGNPVQTGRGGAASYASRVCSPSAAHPEGSVGAASFFCTWCAARSEEESTGAPDQPGA